MSGRNKVIVVSALILSLLLPVIASAKEFPDVPAGYWAQNAINEMAGLGFLAGAPDGNFYPENPVTRAEFAAMIVKSLKLPVKPGDKATFRDVTRKHWAYGVIETASKAGFITGYQGKFRPDEQVTRQEMAVITMRISEKYGYPGDGSTSFLGKYRDYDQVSAWAAPAVSDAARFGYLKEVRFSVYESVYESYRYNRFLSPLDQATRAQAAAALHQLLTKTGLI